MVTWITHQITHIQTFSHKNIKRLTIGITSKVSRLEAVVKAKTILTRNYPKNTYIIQIKYEVADKILQQ